MLASSGLCYQLLEALHGDSKLGGVRSAWLIGTMYTGARRGIAVNRRLDAAYAPAKISKLARDLIARPYGIRLAADPAIGSPRIPPA